MMWMFTHEQAPLWTLHVWEHLLTLLSSYSLFGLLKGSLKRKQCYIYSKGTKMANFTTKKNQHKNGNDVQDSQPPYSHTIATVPYSCNHKNNKNTKCSTYIQRLLNRSEYVCHTFSIILHLTYLSNTLAITYWYYCWFRHINVCLLLSCHCNILSKTNKNCGNNIPTK
jgi:hypothetical protein